MPPNNRPDRSGLIDSEHLQCRCIGRARWARGIIGLVGCESVKIVIARPVRLRSCSWIRSSTSGPDRGIVQPGSATSHS
jgi:hypothetical protein